MLFTYLGVPIFPGRPQKSHLRPIADRVKLKLHFGKILLLSYTGRVHQLVNYVIKDMLLYSFPIYYWPHNLLKEVDSWI